MKRIHALITCLALLALLAGATTVRAEGQAPEAGGSEAGAPENSLQAQTAAVTDITFDYIFLQDPTTSTSWWHSHTVVDELGGVHLAFTDYTSIYYAYCAANCGDPANWLELPLYAVGIYDSLDGPTLGVDAEGHPRLMWWAEYNYGEANYYYAECNAGCADNTANWTAIAVASAGGYDYPRNIRYAALDAQGRPRLVHPMNNDPDYGFYYLSCDAGCTTASNWASTAITTGYHQLDGLQIAFGDNSQPRVLGFDNDTDNLVYAECNSSCNLAANWGSVGLFGPINYWGEYDYFVLRVNAQGYPRVAYYTAETSNNVLYYAWSNASPLTVEGWQSYTLNYPGSPSYWQLDLALDSQGRPSVTFADDTLDLSYVACTANCETNSPTWQQQYIETGDDLDASYPIPTTPGCLSSAWMLFGYPSLALDTADNPNVSYFVRHAQLCYDGQGSPTIVYDARGIRFATAGGAGQNGRQIYLPLIIR